MYDSIKYPLLRLAFVKSAPLVLAYFVLNICGFLSMVLIAQLGLHALAASVIISTTFSSMSMLVMALTLPVAIFSAYYVGKEELDKVGILFRQGMILVTALGFVLVTMMFASNSLLHAFHQPTLVVRVASTYFHVAAYGFLPFCWMFVSGQLFIGLGYMKTYFKFTLSHSLILLLLTCFFIRGFWFIPSLGIAGAGLAFTIASITVFIAQFIYLMSCSDYRRVALFQKNTALPWKPVITMGVYIAVQRGNEFLAWMVLTYLIGYWLLTNALASQQIILQLIMFSTFIPFGISQAAGSLVATYYGKGEARQAYILSWILCGLALVSAIIIAIIFKLNQSNIIGWFSVSQNLYHPIIQLVDKLFIVMLIYIVVDALRIVWFGVLRGFQDVKWPMIASIVSFWIIALPAVWLVRRFYPNNLVAVNWVFLLAPTLSVMTNIYLLFRKRNVI